MDKGWRGRQKDVGKTQLIQLWKVSSTCSKKGLKKNVAKYEETVKAFIYVFHILIKLTHKAQGYDS